VDGRDDVDATAPAHPVGWDRHGKVVPGLRVVVAGARRRLGAQGDRDVTDLEDVGEDRAALLPAGAHAGQREQMPRGAALADGRVAAHVATGVATVELG